MQFSCAPTSEPRLQVGQAYAINGATYYPQIEPNYKEIGKASWYGARFHKRRTANGDVFDKSEFTAAHKTLPLPSVVKVTNLDNGRSLKVVVNDRGPFVRGRIIDVSEAAAAELGFKGRGTARVLVELDRQESLALLKDPRLRVKEAIKKQLVEAYTKEDMSPLKRSLQNLTRMAEGKSHQEWDQKLHPDLQQTTQPSQQDYRVAIPHKPQAQPQQQSQQQMQVVKAQSSQQIPVQTSRVLSPQESLNKTASNAYATNNGSSYRTITPSMKPLSQALNANASAIDAPSGTSAYAIQVASTTSASDADRIIKKLENLSGKIEEAAVNGKKYFRIRVMGLSSLNDANSALNIIKSKGFKDAFIFKNS
jgi:rare lipoprotein A